MLSRSSSAPTKKKAVRLQIALMDGCGRKRKRVGTGRVGEWAKELRTGKRSSFSAPHLLSSYSPRLPLSHSLFHPPNPQNVAIGFSGDPVPPGTASGAAVNKNSHRLRFAA